MTDSYKALCEASRNLTDDELRALALVAQRLTEQRGSVAGSRRHYVASAGVEVTDEYFEIARARMLAEEQGLSPRAAAAGQKSLFGVPGAAP